MLSSVQQHNLDVQEQQQMADRKHGVALRESLEPPETSGIERHQAKTKSELTQLTHEKLTAMFKEPALLQGIFSRCRLAEILP